MHVATVNSPVLASVVSNEKCTASSKAAGFVRHITFDLSGTPLAGSFRAGQAFGVIPPGTDAKGLSHKLRLYSIASPTGGEDGAGNVLATTVKRLIDEHWESRKLYLGIASNYLCDLAPGDKVQLTGPNGKRFLLPAAPADHDYVFFATGTGIAPFRGMIMELLATQVQSRVVLVMGSPYATDLLYHQQLQALAQKHSNFRYLTALSREQQEDGSGPMYVQDRLNASAEAIQPILNSSRGLVYICGIAGMELGIFQRLAGKLAPHVLEQYLGVDEDARETIEKWDRRMIHKQIRPTKRVFLEVY
jgi:ferredoxin--NADP+ reductase